MKIRVLSFCILVSLNILAHADGAKWTSEAEAGLVVTGGNSETQTANGKLSITRESEKWRDTAKLEALNASSTDSTTNTETTTAEKYTGILKADYKYSKASFLFALVDHTDDRFSGFDHQTTVSIGYGRVLLKSDKQLWEAEIGPGIRYYKVSQDETTGQRTPSDSETIVRAATKYQYNFSETSTFTQEFIVESGDDNTISQSISALKAQLVNKLAMKASFKAKRTSEVPVGSDDTDTETALTLVYSF